MSDKATKSKLNLLRFYIALSWSLFLVPVALAIAVIVDVIIGFPIGNLIISSANDNPVVARLILVSVVVLFFALGLFGPVMTHLSCRIEDLETEIEAKAVRSEN